MQMSYDHVLILSVPYSAGNKAVADAVLEKEYMSQTLCAASSHVLAGKRKRSDKFLPVASPGLVSLTL